MYVQYLAVAVSVFARIHAGPSFEGSGEIYLL
jgi:hypothetical protein